MDLNKFTERSKEILNSAQVLAMMQNHQLLQPVHLLSGIIEDDDTASLLLAPAGLDLKSIKLSIEKELKKIPAVTGNAGGISASKEFFEEQIKITGHHTHKNDQLCVGMIFLPRNDVVAQEACRTRLF